MALALLVGATGLSVSRAAGPESSPFAPGVAILAVSAVVAARAHRWWAQLAAVLALVLVLGNQLGNGLHAHLAGEGAGAVATGAWLFVAGSAVAFAAAITSLARATRDRVSHPHSAIEVRDPEPNGRRNHLVLALALMVLSAICAEDLAAYDDTTGHAAELLAGAVLFGCLYGGPALLIREFVRRTGRGWPAILLLATAAGLVQAGLIDQSMFNDSYREIESWDGLYNPTNVGALGLSVYAAQSFVVGHLVYSFSAPIALMEAIRPTAARDAWLGWKGLSIVAVLWLAVAGLVLGDTLVNEPTRPSALQLVGTLAVVAALVAAALRAKGAGATRPTDRKAPRPILVLATSFVLASLLSLAPSTWVGVTASSALLLLSGFLLVRASRGFEWGLTHTVAVAAGAILSRGLIAFSYYPVIGDPSPTRKYTHNVVMLLIVGTAIAIALVRSRNNHALEPLAQESARRSGG